MKLQMLWPFYVAQQQVILTELTSQLMVVEQLACNGKDFKLYKWRVGRTNKRKLFEQLQSFKWRGVFLNS